MDMQVLDEPFDPLKDVAPVASVMYSPVLLIATPASKAKDFKALLDEAKANPGAVRWATSGRLRWATSCWSSCMRRRAWTSRMCRTKAAASS
jgi:tripartite-type tricarboxylate transporter receptor subunit TctC